MAFLPTPAVLCRPPAWSRVSVCDTARRTAIRVARAPRASADASSNAGGGSNSMSDGAVLPDVHPLVLDAQASWLETALRGWLDDEFRTDEAITAHRAIAKQTSLLYRRLRAEGVHDLTTVVLELGGGLEGSEDFVEAFIGPWNVANKAGELLIQNVDATAPRAPEGSGTSDSQTGGQEITGLRAIPPTLNDDFEKYRFLQLILDDEILPPRINGAVAQVAGFVYNPANGSWSGEKVTDAHFATFGDTPPDVLGDETAADWTETLRHMEGMLGLEDDEDGLKAEGFKTLLDTLNGVEMTKLRQADVADHVFAKRSVVVKWLHVIGDFC